MNALQVMPGQFERRPEDPMERIRGLLLLAKMVGEYRDGGHAFDPENEIQPTRLRDEHEVLSDLRQAATVGRPRRLSLAGWLVLGSLVAAAAAALWRAT